MVVGIQVPECSERVYFGGVFECVLCTFACVRVRVYVHVCLYVCDCVCVCMYMCVGSSQNKE